MIDRYTGEQGRFNDLIGLYHSLASNGAAAGTVPNTFHLQYSPCLDQI